MAVGAAVVALSVSDALGDGAAPSLERLLSSGSVCEHGFRLRRWTGTERDPMATSASTRDTPMPDLGDVPSRSGQPMARLLEAVRTVGSDLELAAVLRNLSSGLRQSSSSCCV